MAYSKIKASYIGLANGECNNDIQQFLASINPNCINNKNNPFFKKTQRDLESKLGMTLSVDGLDNETSISVSSSGPPTSFHSQDDNGPTNDKIDEEDGES